MESLVKTNRLSITSIAGATLVPLIYLLMIVITWLFPPPPPHISPFFSAAAPLFLLMGFALFFLGPLALITGIIALQRIRKGIGNQKGRVLALIGLIIGGVQTALIVLPGIFSLILFIVKQ